jgi:GNAT superfamily N-acetyltransferase
LTDDAGKETTLQTVIKLSGDRYPRALLKDRDTIRHIKVVDPETGTFLGYARWTLPEKYSKHDDGSPAWQEGQVPDVDNEQRDEIEKKAEVAQAQWHPTEFVGEDDLDAILTTTKNAILAKKDYVGALTRVRKSLRMPELMRVTVLDYIAVHPSHQKKGVGLALIQNGVAKARSLGLDVFVLACEGGFKLYEKAGFKEVDRIVQDATRIGGTIDYQVRFMVHEMVGT